MSEQKKSKDTQSETELALIALLLKVGGHDLHLPQIEAAKMHNLVIEHVQEYGLQLTRLSAIPKPKNA